MGIIKAFWMFLSFLLLCSETLGKCGKCHKFDVASHVHPPFAEADCETCHIGRADVGFHVRWLRFFECFSGVNCVEVDDGTEEVFVRIGKRVPYKVKTWGHFSSKPESRAKLCYANRGVFLTIGVCVESSVPSVADIRCGDSVSSTDVYRTFNPIEVDLPVNLKKVPCSVKICYVTGACDSKNVSFVLFDGIPSSLDDGDIEKFETFFVETGEERFVCVRTDGYARCGVGVGTERGVRMRNHPSLTSFYVAGLDRCYACHPKGMLGISHPVGVVPSDKMSDMVDESKLVDGKVVCVSCHSPHSSDQPYLLRAPYSQLCVSCHRDKVY